MKLLLALACTCVATTFFTTSLWATSYTNSQVTSDTILIELHIAITDQSANNYLNQLGTKQDLKSTSINPLQSLNLLVTHTSPLLTAKTSTTKTAKTADAPAITINITLPQITPGIAYENQLNTYPNSSLSSSDYNISQLNQPMNKLNYNSQPIDMPLDNDLYLPLASNQNISTSFNNNVQQQVVVNNQQLDSPMSQQNKVSYKSSNLFDDLYNTPKQVMF